MNMVAFWAPNLGSAMLPNPVVLKALTTRAPLAQDATCSAPDVVWPTTRPLLKPSAPPRTGLVASMSTFPERFPADWTALWAPSQGTVRATTAAEATASAGLAARALAPAADNNFW